MIMEITSKELQEKIENGDKIVVDFYADWCQPCKAMKPIFEKVSKQNTVEKSEVQTYTMDVGNNRDISIKYGIRSVPMIKSFNGGNVIETKSGIQSEEEIKDIVNNLING